MDHGGEVAELITLVRFIVIGLIVTLAACSERPRAGADPLATNAIPLDSTTFPGRVVTELSALKQGITPAQWLSEHSRDSLTPFFTSAEINQDSNQWCVRATRRDSLKDGSPIVRDAYFYPPPPPASLELPSDKDEASLIERACVLGAIWTQAAVSDSASGHQLAEHTRSALMGVHGGVTPREGMLARTDSFLGGPLTDSQKLRMRDQSDYENIRLGISFFGSSYWLVPGRWQRGPMTVVSAFDAEHGRTPRPRVLAFAYLPNAQFEKIDYVDEPDSASGADTALKAAGRLTHLDAGVVRDFLALREKPDSDRIAGVGKWLGVAANLDPARRAAAFFLADAVVPARLSHEDTVTTHAYANLGLKFFYAEPDAMYVYSHSLLEESLRLDPVGPVGQLATIEMLNRGFDLTGTCGGGFEQVIKAGEPFVDRLSTSGSKANILFLLGDAYADVVALAAGEGGDNVDTAGFKARAPSARRKAIAYYRQGLTLERKSAQARAAWAGAWRLLAGLPPVTTHFFCIFD